jgi:hypothetical protein
MLKALPVFGAGIFQIGIDDLEGPREGNAEGAGDCGSSASVSSPKHRPSGGRAVIEDRRELDLFNLFEFADERAKRL